MLTVLIGAVALLCVSALAAAFCSRWERLCLLTGKVGALVACAAGTGAAVSGIVRGLTQAVETPFATPLGPLRVSIDPLSSFFLLCVFLVSGLAALYGIGYLRAHAGRRSLAGLCAWFNLLIASMAMVVLAGDAVLFLFSWEIMTVSSFFLVVSDSDREDVRSAGITYLVASQSGVIFLFLLFVLLAQPTGQFDFTVWAKAGTSSPAWAGVCFILAVVGFGTKAGLWPVHVWLPQAHPAAPTHVSALMSGVMIKLGIYGILRTLTFLGPAPSWWGVSLVVIGVVSGVLGVLHALAQHDLKRLLAYHSVENIGIITMGIGLGLIGRSVQMPAIAALGFGGALLHTLNHGLFKGLLFQSAGSVLQATSESNIDRLGGLSRRMPHTALAFLVGSIAISGLPPLNGFISEWLIYLGAFRGAAAFSTGNAVASLLLLSSLALIGGLAVACFVKAFHVVFLGEARAIDPAGVKEADGFMCAAMWTGMILCAAIGLGAVPVLGFLTPAIAGLTGMPMATPLDAGPVNGLVLASTLLIALAGGLAGLRWLLLRGRSVETGATWGCGYPQPTPRMQYTSSSFADPVIEPFRAIFHSSRHATGMVGVFPAHASHEDHLEDRAQRVLFPAVRLFARALAHVQLLQRSRVQLYLAYILATLVLLLVWFMARGGF